MLAISATKADQIQTQFSEKLLQLLPKRVGGDIILLPTCCSWQPKFDLSVLDSTGGGGNITIDTDFIVAQETVISRLMLSAVQEAISKSALKISFLPQTAQHYCQFRIY